MLHSNSAKPIVSDGAMTYNKFMNNNENETTAITIDGTGFLRLYQRIDIAMEVTHPNGTVEEKVISLSPYYLAHFLMTFTSDGAKVSKISFTDPEA